MGAAISDIVAYYNAGSLVRAFTKLQEDTAIATNNAETHLKNLREAGVKGAPSELELKTSNEISNSIGALWKAYQDANNSVAAQERQLTTANQTITQANADIEKADQDIAAASARINAAPNPAAKTQAEADKAKAEADKLKAQASKTKAEGEKTAAETAKTEAIAARDKAFNNLKGTYEAVEADDKLSPLLNKVPNNPDFVPAFKARVEAMLKRRREKKLIETDADRKEAAEDYATILRQLGGIVAKSADSEAALSERMTKILNVNK